MGSIQNTVYYCCVARGNRVLYAHSSGDHELENLALLCLERTPPFHKWYFETMGNRTFGFLIEDGYVYFTIVGENVGNPGVLQFLEHLRDEFKEVARKGSRGSLSSLNLTVQEQLVPVIRRLITSLENVSHRGRGWTGETPSLHAGSSPSPTSSANGQTEVCSSTKAPLLGKSSKQEKKKGKDHVIAIREVELEEHRKSTDRGVNVDSISATLDSSDQGEAGSSIPLQKELGPMRIRSSTQSIRKKWWRQVRIVLAVDAAVCLLLFVIWLFICHGIECIR
ncbi:Longin domain containing protein [Parasponia andersonii]|uniref:Longin domain containing protein n=1 Tax=Parasponia andersonii TaxID=3476 RepID=A0A2P5AED0_PARAD|nr:Longin domain containing protein [Parasponia andersonii]